jgi:putative ABC transport system substrate-binding protein
MDLIHCLSITGTIILTETITKIPVVGYAVYKGDASSMGYSGDNITGVIVKGCVLQDLWPVEAQLEMYVKFMPESKKWGTVYNSGSANARYHIKELQDVSKVLGVELVESPVSKPSEIREATQSLVGKVDAIYITSDKMAMSGIEEIADVCNKNSIPLFSGEFEGVSKGAAAAYNMNYFLVGYNAGKLGARILKGENPKDITPEFTKKLELVISPENARKQGLAITEELKQIADKIL